MYSVALPSVVFLFAGMFALLTNVRLAPDKIDVLFEGSIWSRGNSSLNPC
jgi:hypothetical protein